MAAVGYIGPQDVLSVLSWSHLRNAEEPGSLMFCELESDSTSAVCLGNTLLAI